MSKPKDIRFLELLEPKDVVIEEVVITDFMVANFKQPPEGTKNDRDPGSLFLKHLEARGLIFVVGNPFGQIMVWEYAIDDQIYKRWWDTSTEPVKAAITDKGIDYLNEFRLKDNLLAVNKSNIDTNTALRSSLKVQKRISYLTAAAIVLTAIYAVTAYYKDEPKNLILIRKSMQQQERLLDRIRLSQKAIDSSLRIMANKTSPKKF
jgi:hypothetical protein